MMNQLKNHKHNILAIIITELIAFIVLIAFLIFRHFFSTGIGNAFRMIFMALTLGLAFASYLVIFLYRGLCKSRTKKMTVIEWKKHYRATFIIAAVFILLTIGIYIITWNFPPYDYPLVKVCCIVYGILIIIGLSLSPLIYFTIIELLDLRRSANETIVTKKEDPLWLEEAEEKKFN